MTADPLDQALDRASAHARRNGTAVPAYEPTWGEPDKKTGKRPYFLAALPAQDDAAGLCEWLTLNLGLDRDHPIVRGRRFGTHDTDGSAVLERRGAPELRFSPITRLSTPTKLLETLGAGMTNKDGVAPPLTGEHCPRIFAAVRWLCDCTAEITSAERVGGIVRAFLSGAERTEGEHTTYGETTSSERYVVAQKLTPVRGEYGREGPYQYLVDSQTGEMVIRASDLQAAARAAEGSSLRRGELDALLGEHGWKRITIDGHQNPGRDGRSGPHARVFAYRGVLATADVPDAVVDEPDGAVDERPSSTSTVTT